MAAVRLLIGGEHEVADAGEQGTFVGLDQATAELSRSLNGRGEVDVSLRVDGQWTNVVPLRFQ